MSYDQLKNKFWTKVNSQLSHIGDERTEEKT